MYKKYIPEADYFSQGLYMFDIGQNDLAGEFYSKTEDQVAASIPTILLEFETGLKVCKICDRFHPYCCMCPLLFSPLFQWPPVIPFSDMIGI
jgi:hypothetical protein